ncbi:DUF6249 domain-containing protein [Gaoshiqia sp. Z1-71]|uniref:DUF6249 domain-containing protein n=1 Tax=Gaoshiqia hydrogeniformans TaxID=3290090 RepID=UPI003BF8AED1
MMDFITIPLVVGMITLGIYKLFELFVHRKERLTMIEKIGSTFDASMVQNKFNFPEKNRPVFGTLKIACLLLGVGLGLLLGFVLSHSLGLNDLLDGNHYIRETVGVIYGASVLLFGGIGLLIAFILEMKYSKKPGE